MIGELPSPISFLAAAETAPVAHLVGRTVVQGNVRVRGFIARKVFGNLGEFVALAWIAHGRDDSLSLWEGR